MFLDLLHLVKQILHKGCSVHFVKEKLDFTSDESNPMGKLMLSMFGAIAEFERALIRDRQREGIEIAKKKGKYKGRPDSLTKEQIEEMKKFYLECQNKSEVARRFNIHAKTVRKYLNAI